jgi:hypothetical protein
MLHRAAAGGPDRVTRFGRRCEDGHSRQKMRSLTATLGAQQEEGNRLDAAIRKSLASLGYRVGMEDAP